MNFMRMLENIKKSYNWEEKLNSANDLFHLGPKKFEDAVKRYGKIFEILIGYLYKEIIPTLPYKKKKSVFETEKEVGKGKAFDKLGLGQMIRVFSRSSLFEHVNRLCKTQILDSQQLEKINAFRVEQTHYDEDIRENKVDQIREYTTTVLLQLKLIAKDPEKMIEIEGTKESDARLIRMQGLQRILKKIRLGLIEKAFVQYRELLERGNGWIADAEIQGEIAGAYLSADETFTILVRVFELLDVPENEDEAVYEGLSSKVRETIESIAPEAKQKLKILFFDEVNESGLAGSAHVCWDVKDGLFFQ